MSESRETDTIVPVPMLDLKAQYAQIRGEISAAIERVLESQTFILGPEAGALEEEVAAYSQCQHAIGVSSGTDALLVSLMAIGVGPGDEVITTPYTFFATAAAIARLGAKPVFVDIEAGTFNIDASAIEGAVTARTGAIIPVHLFGQVADMDAIMAIADRYNLFVIEDAAQAIGAEYKGRRAGSIGHLGAFSFYPTKNLGGYGDGGMVTTSDAELADRVRLLRNHGFRPKYHNRVLGGNFRLDAIQAAVLRTKLKYLDGWTEARQLNAASYRRLFAQAELAAPYAGATAVNGVALPIELPERRHIYNQFVVRVGDRDRDSLSERLRERGIGTEVYYPVPLHLQECFDHLEYGPGDLPHSEKAAAETLALPIYPELTEQMQAAVVDAIADFMATDARNTMGR